MMLEHWVPRPRCAVKHLEEVTMPEPKVVEICAGAGGQSLGLELAGFEHDLSVELDPSAVRTLRSNRPHWKVARRGCR